MPLLPLPRPPCSGASADLGINLAGLADWSTEQPYADIARVARSWNPGSVGLTPLAWTFGAVPPLDASGYPTRLADGVGVGTMLLRDLQGHYAPGTYTVTWRGEGTVTVSMDDVRGSVRRIAPGLIEVDAWPGTGLNNGIYVSITRTDPADPVRDMHVIAPGALATWAAFP